jgi:hypothetical protein
MLPTPELPVQVRGFAFRVSAIAGACCVRDLGTPFVLDMIAELPLDVNTVWENAEKKYMEKGRSGRP